MQAPGFVSEMVAACAESCPKWFLSGPYQPDFYPPLVLSSQTIDFWRLLDLFGFYCVSWMQLLPRFVLPLLCELDAANFQRRTA